MTRIKPSIPSGVIETMKLFQVDAFTDKPFSGNPAAVCILTEPRSDTWMQNVAKEMNLSETAFLLAQEDGYSLRWFTPKVEVDLCGHATLASAHILWEEGYLQKAETARFHTRSGLLTCEIMENLITLNFPAKLAAETSAPAGLIQALGITPLFVGKNRFDYIVEVASEEIVRKLKPNFALLSTFPVRGVIVTSRSKSSDYDFVSRFFAPGAGIDEDPVTGSAHCCLGPYWQERLKKDEFSAYQASERGGTLRVRVAGDRVFIAGKAVTIIKGELLV